MSAPLSVCMDDTLHPEQKEIKVQFIPVSQYHKHQQMDNENVNENENSNNDNNTKHEKNGVITVTMSRESKVREMEVALQQTISSVAHSSWSWKHFRKITHKPSGRVHLLMSSSIPIESATLQEEQITELQCNATQDHKRTNLTPLSPHTTLDQLLRCKADSVNNGSSSCNPLRAECVRDTTSLNGSSSNTLTLYYDEETKYGNEADLCLACCAMMACCAACCAAEEAMANRQQNTKPNNYNNNGNYNGGGYPNQVPNYNVPPQQPPPNYYPNPTPQQYPPPPGVNDNYYSQNQYGLPPNAATPPPPGQPVYGQPIYYNQPPGMPQPQYNTGKPPAL